MFTRTKSFSMRPDRLAGWVPDGKNYAPRLAIAAVAGTCVSLGGLPALGVLAAVAGLSAPAHAQCGLDTLTQSTSPEVIQTGRAAWCGTLAYNDLTQIGRGFVAPYDLTIGCVRFGVTRNTGADWPCIVRIRLGSLADPYDTHAVLSEATVVIPAGTSSEMFTAEIGTVFLPAGTAFVVELETPSRNPASGGDGALLSLGFNALGQSGPSMLRSEPCGVPEFTDLATIGFANSHAAISVGVSPGVDLPILGGMPVAPIGAPAVGTFDGFTTVYGDGNSTPFGLSIDFGDTTMGVNASFRALSTGDEADPTLAIAFKSQPGTVGDRLVFRNNPATPDEAVLELDFDTAAFDRFNVHVFRGGELVGTLTDQTSGSVRFTKPDDGPIWDWIKGLFGGGVKAGCSIKKEYYPASEGGGLKSETMFYGIETGTAFVVPTGGGLPGYRGDEIWIEPMAATVGLPPPLVMELTATGIVGIALDVTESTPGVVIGTAESGIRPFGAGTTTQPGVSFLAIKEKGIGKRPPKGHHRGTDVTGDGVPDLVFVPSSDAGPGEGVRMELGGVASASVGIDVVALNPAAACMTVCAFEVGPISIPSGKTSFDPWPIDPALTAVAPDFTGVGDETYTFQVYDLAGTLVHEATGLSGIAGGTTRWPWKVGKLGGRTPCFRICYPQGTFLRLADGREFEVHEVRALAEGAPEAGPLASLDISVLNMDQLVLFDPVTELPAGVCYADLDGDGTLTIFDFLAFQNAFDAGLPVADCDGDGTLTIFDFLCFQNAFDAGCS